MRIFDAMAAELIANDVERVLSPELIQVAFHDCFKNFLNSQRTDSITECARDGRMDGCSWHDVTPQRV